ncbi:hypothetical protein DFH11DRAFT_61294 [Phellopilus nigrolimitatus]|nr:hypothetical protein DFH11DRAFT_61294 [Phellopilus nigrolimitatus]
MLVHTYNHLIPHVDGQPTAYSSSTTSSYIPDISYDDLNSTPQPPSPLVASHRRERRMRAAPYPPSISSNVAAAASWDSSSSQHFTQSPEHYAPQSVPLHSPRPVQFYNPVHALNRSNAACTGAHGTILGAFSPHPEPTSAAAEFGELTATQMACTSSAQAANSSPLDMTPPASAYDHFTPQAHNAHLSYIQVPQVPHIPQIPQASSLGYPAPSAGSNPPFLPAAIPPAASDLHTHPTDKLPPPQNTFPTPSELLVELSARDRDTQKTQKRVKHRKSHQDQVAKDLGYTPTDPDTISSHDKKRYYLDCLEHYVLYLHDQLRLVGVEPVPVERVSSGRGLTSRSIRTMIVHLQNSVSKLHSQKKEAEVKYNVLREQLGADSDQGIPSSMDGRTSNLTRRHSVSYPAPDPHYNFPC